MQPAPHEVPDAPISPGHAEPRKWSTPTINRLVIAILCVTVFFSIKTFAPKPKESNADIGAHDPNLGMPATQLARRSRTPQAAAIPGDAQASVTPPQIDAQGRAFLGKLVGREHQVWIFGTKEQPVYTVLDLKGNVLASELLADEVYQQFPDLPVHELRFDGPSGAIMSAEKTRGE
jgi:hypothetical protein